MINCLEKALLSFKRTLAGLCVAGLAMTGAVAASAPASAAVSSYDVTIGMLEDDGTTAFTVSGSFSFDPAMCGASPCPEAYSGISISVPERPFAFLPAITYTEVDICPSAGPSVCNGAPVSEGSALSLGNVDGPYQALVIGFSPGLTASEPGLDLANTSAYAETGDSTAVSGTLTNTTPQPDPQPDPQPQAQVPNAGSVTVPAKLARRGAKKIASASPVTNAGQPVQIRVTCKATRGDLRVCSKIKKKKGTFVRTYGTAARVRIVWSAPAVEGFTAYRQAKAYRI